jgi:hypothetical protein
MKKSDLAWSPRAPAGSFFGGWGAARFYDLRGDYGLVGGSRSGPVFSPPRCTGGSVSGRCHGLAIAEVTA